MNKTETIATRIPAEDKQALEQVAKKMRIQTADLVRAAIGGVSDAAQRDGGEVVLPVRVWSLQEKAALEALNESAAGCVWALPGEDTDGLLAAVQRLARTMDEHKDTLRLTLRQRGEVAAAAAKAATEGKIKFAGKRASK